MKDSIRFHFIWGPGGVGKSHLAIRETALSQKRTLLLTLDPSPRIFHLMATQPKIGAQEVAVGSHRFHLRRTDAFRLFADLESRVPAPPAVKEYFLDLVKGLQRFRDYLSLVELGDEMGSDSFPRITIDTPPFQEAKHFQESILYLNDFFDRSLVQLGLRNDWLQFGVRKILDGMKLITGAANLEKTLNFLDWLGNHIDRLQKSAKSLHREVFSDQSLHTIVLTPESDLEQLKKMKDFFSKAKNLRLVLNRSVSHFEIPSTDHPYLKEFQTLKAKEKILSEEIQRIFSLKSFERIPLQVMGEDTLEELLKFIEIAAEAEDSLNLRADGKR